MQGWISLHRKIMHHPFYTEKRKFSKYEAWIDIILLANHQDNKFVHGNKLVEVERGSFITSELKLMNKWGWGKEKLRSFLKLLEADGMIVKISDRKQTTVKVLHYSDYQVSPDHQQTDSRPSPDTNNNVNNENPKKTSRPKPEKRVYDQESPSYVLAQFYLNKILQFKPDFKKPDLQTWADDMRKLIELDKRDPKEIAKVIQWVTKDLFWQPIAQCPAKLRQKWDTITTRMRNEGVRPSNKNVVQFSPPPITDKEREDLADITRKQAERNGVPFALS